MEPLYFENFDLENVVTPVNVEALRKLLHDTNYDKHKIEFLVDGFTNGFSLEYDGPEDVQLMSENLKLRGVGNKTILWNKVMKEVAAKRYAGPFEQIPFDNYIQSPIGLVPKDWGRDVRLIFHLSYPRGKNSSVNANTPKEKSAVSYPDFSEAIQLCVKAGRSCKLSKSDMKSAFRNLGLCRRHWKFLIMKCESPIDGKTYYFVDKCLSFGASISCAHFQAFSNAISHIVSYKTKKENVNYLDDFIFIALLRAFCDGQLEMFLSVCRQINFPVSMDKTFWSCTQLTFLGCLINTVTQTVTIPAEKVLKARGLISKVLAKASKKITVKELQQICGFLNFLGRCVVPGRAFTRRLYAYTTTSQKLRPHHHIQINGEMRADLSTWLSFVNHSSVFARQFMDFSKFYNAIEISMFSDASKSKVLGMGGVCDSAWMFAQWPAGFIEAYDPSIEYLELYALVATVINWVYKFRNKRIILFCDNQSVVHMVNKMTSSCRNCMILIRMLVLKGLTENVRIFAKYIKSGKNKAVDYLSRLKFDAFLKLRDDWETTSTPVPAEMWPPQKIWLK